MSTATAPDPQAVARRVLDFYRRQRRDLPWRRTRDPYAIWISEIMLQQTRVAAAIPYYERWLARFPTVQTLAAADLDDVLGLWAGLGYYSRARNLHRGAREVVERHGGELPRCAEALRRLPGIGPYTAGAIASMAYGLREPLVDGNVARVLARLYALDGDVRSTPVVRQLWTLAVSLVPARAPGDFNQGLMELGATVCLPQNPQCERCPLADLCRARATGRQEELPVMPARRRAADLPLIDRAAVWIEERGALLLGRRPPTGLYGGLWELPQASRLEDIPAACGVEPALAGRRPVFEHGQVLTHRRLRIRVWRATRRGALGRPDPRHYDQLAWQALPAVAALGLSAATAAILAAYHESEQWTRNSARSPSSSRATRRSSRDSTSSATRPGRTRTSAPRRSARRVDSAS
jgi:A/G-specific adenine glycosylase